MLEMRFLNIKYSKAIDKNFERIYKNISLTRNHFMLCRCCIKGYPCPFL